MSSFIRVACVCGHPIARCYRWNGHAYATDYFDLLDDDSETPVTHCPSCGEELAGADSAEEAGCACPKIRALIGEWERFQSRATRLAGLDMAAEIDAIKECGQAFPVWLRRMTTLGLATDAKRPLDRIVEPQSVSPKTLELAQQVLRMPPDLEDDANVDSWAERLASDISKGDD